MRPNRQYQSKSFAEKRHRRAVIGVLAIIVTVVSWTFVISRISFLPSLAIDTVHIYGTDPEMAQSLEEDIISDMQGSYIGLFSRANTFIYPKSQIVGAIASGSSLFGSVDVRRDGWRTLAISVLEKTPDAMICRDLPDLNISEKPILTDNCYVVDVHGNKLRKARADEVKNYNHYYMPEATTTSLVDIQAFVKRIKSAGVNVVSILIKGDGGYEIYAQNPDTQSLVVIQATDEADLNIESENLILFWRKAVDESRISGIDIEWNEIKLQYPPNVYYTESK